MKTKEKQNIELYTLRQASVRLAVSLNTLRGWVDAGRLQVFRPTAGTIRVSQAELDRFVRDNTVSRAAVARAVTGGLALAVAVGAMLFLTPAVGSSDATTCHRLASQGTVDSLSNHRTVRQWRRAGSPVPVQPISHHRDGTLRTGTADAWGRE